MSQKVDKFLPVSKPEISQKTVEALVEVVSSGWIATGPKTQEFERKLTDYFDGNTALTVTSNTVGLYTSLKAIGIKPGDKVITTPLTFAATVNAIELAGATPIFVDVDKSKIIFSKSMPFLSTMELNIESLKKSKASVSLTLNSVLPKSPNIASITRGVKEILSLMS